MVREPETKYPKGRAESYLIIILSKFEFLKAKTMISKDFLKTERKKKMSQTSQACIWFFSFF